MGSKFLAQVMVLAVVVAMVNAGRHLTTKDDEGLDTPQPLPLPLPTQQDDIPQPPPLVVPELQDDIPQPEPQPQPPVVPELPEKEEEKEFNFYMHHSLGVTSGAGGGLNGNGGGPLPLTFPLGALLNNPNNLGNGLGGIGGGGALFNGVNGLGVGGPIGGGVLGGIGLTTPNFIGGSRSQEQLGGANDGVGLRGNQGYGHMVMLEEPITHDSYEGSPAMGIAQGYFMEMEMEMEMESSHKHAHSMLAMSFTASFHDGEYSGNSVQLAGQINMDDNNEDSKGNGSENVLQVVDGSGVFEKAIGHHALVHAIPSLHQDHQLLFKISIPL